MADYVQGVQQLSYLKNILTRSEKDQHPPDLSCCGQPYEFINDDIRATKEYNKTPSAHRTPTPTTIAQKKKRKQVAGKTSSPRKSLKVTIKQKKPSTTPIPPPSDDKERDEIAEATQMSLALHKITNIIEEQKNMEIVQKKLREEDIEKIVDSDNEESYASEFADSVFQDNNDFENRIEPGSHKEHPETVDDDDDKNRKEMKDDKKDDVNDDDVNDDHTDHSLEKTQETGSLESRKEKMQTPISSPYRSPMTNLSLDKIISMELTDTVSPTPDTTSQGHSKHTSINTKDLPDNAPPEGEKGAKRKMPNKETIDTNDIKMCNLGETRDPYSIVDKLTTGLIYLNIKEEKRVMYLVEIVKFCDAMQESVLKEVKLKIFEIVFWKKPPLLGELGLDIM
ncbi:hypothetical protein Tco_0897974 [Tanacetum coccineum]